MVSVVNSVDTTHEDMVHDAQMDYYGTKLATCSSDKTIKIFNCSGSHSQHQSTSTMIADLRGHEGQVWQIAWAHPMYGSVLASCGYDKRVIVWKEQAPTSADGNAFSGNATPKWEKIYEYKEHLSSVNSVCWAPYDVGLVLAAASSDGSISVHTYQQADGSWEVQRISNAHPIGCNSVSWAPSTPPNAMMESLNANASSDSSSVNGASNGHLPVKKIVSGGSDNMVKIWACKPSGEWELEEKLEAHSDWVRDAAWAPSIGLPRSLIASCGQDKCVYLWEKDGATGKWASRVLHQFSDVIYHVSWSLLGNVLAVSSGDNTVTLWKEMAHGEWACIANDVGKAGTVPTQPSVAASEQGTAEVTQQQQQQSRQMQQQQQQQQHAQYQQYQPQMVPQHQYMMPSAGAAMQ